MQRESLNLLHSVLSGINVESSAILLVHFVVKHAASKACDCHISWFVGDCLLSDLSWTLSGVSLVEGLGLVKLLSVLGSVLVGVEVLLSGPAGSVPKGGIHRVSRAVVVECLSWAVQIGLILDVLVELSGALSRKDKIGISISEHATWMSLRVEETSSESGLVWRIPGMVVGMSERFGSSAISPGGSVQSIVGAWNQGLVEAGGGHGSLRVIQSLLLENVSTLLGESLLQMRVSSNLRSITSVAREDVVLSLNGFVLPIGYWNELTYPIRHVVVAGSVHVAIGPVEEVRLGNGRLPPVSQRIELVLSLAKHGVIEVGASRLRGQHFIRLL